MTLPWRQWATSHNHFIFAINTNRSILLLSLIYSQGLPTEWTRYVSSNVKKKRTKKRKKTARANRMSKRAAQIYSQRTRDVASAHVLYNAGVYRRMNFDTNALKVRWARPRDKVISTRLPPSEPSSTQGFCIVYRGEHVCKQKLDVSHFDERALR